MDNLISRVSSAQYLGITVTDNLCWNEHINNICKKANSTLGLLRRIFSGCDKKVKDLAYCSLVRLRLEYDCSACRAGNNSRSSDIVRPNFEYFRPISHFDRTRCPNISMTQLTSSPTCSLSVKLA